MKFGKISLIRILEDNKKKHTADYEEAREEYQVKLVKVLEKALGSAKEGKEGDYMLSLPTRCTDHTKDYERVLSMLRATTDDQITLDQAGYSKYVLDDWDWKEEFLNTKLSYSR